MLKTAQTPPRQGSATFTVLLQLANPEHNRPCRESNQTHPHTHTHQSKQWESFTHTPLHYSTATALKNQTVHVSLCLCVLEEGGGICQNNFKGEEKRGGRSNLRFDGLKDGSLQ